jgi:hypothetical protein
LGEALNIGVVLPEIGVGAADGKHANRLPGKSFDPLMARLIPCTVSLLHIRHYDGFPLDPLPETCSETSRASTIAG